MAEHVDKLKNDFVKNRKPLIEGNPYIVKEKYEMSRNIIGKWKIMGEWKK